MPGPQTMPSPFLAKFARQSMQLVAQRLPMEWVLPARVAMVMASTKFKLPTIPRYVSPLPRPQFDMPQDKTTCKAIEIVFIDDDIRESVKGHDEYKNTNVVRSMIVGPHMMAAFDLPPPVKCGKRRALSSKGGKRKKRKISAMKTRSKTKK